VSSKAQELPWSQVVGRKTRKTLPPQKGGSVNLKKASSTPPKSGGLSPSGGVHPKRGKVRRWVNPQRNRRL
jgi:2-keto-3-deoxy-6-phosphogluconate aldolase